MATPHNPPPTSPSPPRFRLAFHVVSDGLETAAAQTLNTLRGRSTQPFPYFVSLPPELRLKIWEYLITPRVLAVACLDAEAPPPEEEPEEPWATFPDDMQTGPSPASQVPVLLRVNRETRELALKQYEPAFAWKTPYVMLSSIPHFHAPSTSATPIPGSTWSRPSAWFNFTLDALYLLGQLEPCDSYGFNSPMAYFLDREEARRVRRIGVAFAALKFGEMAPQHIFGALFHCVDRFSGAVDAGGGKVLVAVTPRDEYTNALMGGQQPLVSDGSGDGKESDVYTGEWSDVNVVQKTWRDWYRGSIVTSSLARVQFELVRESDLPQRIAI